MKGQIDGELELAGQVMERERGIAVEKTSRQQSHHAQGHHVVGLSAELRCRAVGGGEEGFLFDHAGKRPPHSGKMLQDHVEPEHEQREEWQKSRRWRCNY